MNSRIWFGPINSNFHFEDWTLLGSFHIFFDSESLVYLYHRTSFNCWNMKNGKKNPFYFGYEKNYQFAWTQTCSAWITLISNTGSCEPLVSLSSSFYSLNTDIHGFRWYHQTSKLTQWLGWFFFSYLTDFSYIPLIKIFWKLQDMFRTVKKRTLWK
jgi:hypothetical protein